MNGELFYTTNGDQAVPVYLISQSAWQGNNNSFTAAEQNALTLHQFKGKLGDCCLIINADGLIKKVYVGLGEGNQERALAHAAVSLPAGKYYLEDQTLTLNTALTWALAQYRFVAYKKNELQPKILVVNTKIFADLLALTQSVFLVRDLINRPTNDMGPKELAAVLEELANHHQAQFKQWVGEELLAENFPAIHAVGRASINAPRLLSLTWGNQTDFRLTLVGKGVCFDTGGVNIKPSSGMRLMKKDMGGAAHVIGLANWIMEKKLPIRLEVLIPAVENSIGPDAFRPGDILTMRNGLTVEIDNTDAEGRLILADALVKACEANPNLIIDFATLTGAARIAVGTEIAALFTNQDELALHIEKASEKTGDAVWRLPLFQGYKDLLNSSVADLANCSGSPFAGAITAGLFLQRFVAENIPWLHFDVGAWNISSKPGKPEGGEAMGLRAVIDYLMTNPLISTNN